MHRVTLKLLGSRGKTFYLESHGTSAPFLNLGQFYALFQIAKATVSFVMSVRPPVCPYEQIGSHLTDSHEILHLGILRKSIQKIQDSLKYDKNNGYLTQIPIYSYDNISLNFFLKWEIFQTNIVEIIKTHILCSKYVCKNGAVYEIMWKNIVQPDRPQMFVRSNEMQQ